MQESIIFVLIVDLDYLKVFIELLRKSFVCLAVRLKLNIFWKTRNLSKESFAGPENPLKSIDFTGTGVA